MANDWLEIAQRIVASLTPMKIGDLSSIVRGAGGDVEREGDKVRILADMYQCSNRGQDVFVETSASGKIAVGCWKMWRGQRKERLEVLNEQATQDRSSTVVHTMSSEEESCDQPFYSETSICESGEEARSGCLVRPRRNATPTEWYETFRRVSEGPKRKAL